MEFAGFTGTYTSHFYWICKAGCGTGPGPEVCTVFGVSQKKTEYEREEREGQRDTNRLYHESRDERIIIHDTQVSDTLSLGAQGLVLMPFNPPNIEPFVNAEVPFAGE